MKRWLAGIALSLALAGSGWTHQTNSSTILVPPDNAFAARATELQKTGASFDTIFTELCKLVIADLDAKPKLRNDDQVRALFGGLWLWMRQGGKPTLQNQTDKALHFIGGGTFQGYFDMGWDAAIAKERLDS